jgi:hypothetical protein
MTRYLDERMMAFLWPSCRFASSNPFCVRVNPARVIETSSGCGACRDIELLRPYLQARLNDSTDLFNQFCKCCK